MVGTNLFISTPRRARSLTLGCFDTTLLATVDIFRSTMQAQTPCNRTVTLELPLDFIFETVPPNHRVLPTASRSFRVNNFYRFDANFACLEPIPLSANPPFPRLARKLQREINQGILSLHPAFQNMSLPSDEFPGNFDDQPFLECFRTESSWATTNKSTLRYEQTLILLDHTPKVSFPPTSWYFFWHLPLAPEARSIWYRPLYGKVRNRLSVSLFGASVSPFCQLCGSEHEDIVHFFITCPFKLHVWQQAFMRFAPYLEFSVSGIHDLVFSLQQYQLVNNEQLFVLSSKILLSIWRHHGRLFFDGVPFQTELVLKQVFK